VNGCGKTLCGGLGLNPRWSDAGCNGMEQNES